MIAPSPVEASSPGDRAWRDACLAAACIAIDPVGLGGVRVRSSSGPVRDGWSRMWRSLLASGTPVRAIPLSIDDGRLFGGLDLTASLQAGRPVRLPGVLAEADRGYVVLAMAERIDPATAARIATAVESGRTDDATPTRAGVIAFDEGDADEAIPGTLAERLGLAIELREVAPHAIDATGATGAYTAQSIAAARARLADVGINDELVAALCSAALALGIRSMRVPLFAVRAARALAALDGRDVVDTDDAAAAARLVYAPRARQLPSNAPEESAAPEERADDAAPADDAEAPDERDGETDEEPPEDHEPLDDRGRPLDDVVLDAAVAAIPAALLGSLAAGAARTRSASARGGGAGARGLGRMRGAPAGVRRGRPRSPERLSLIETLRAAAPWQRIRRIEAGGDGSSDRKVRVRAEDLHVVRFVQRHPTTTIFVVDASGSSALHRLAEAKGAVELLLADCYVRRDSVAVLAFRGNAAELVLPPTRSLVRARRSLARMPGGGGTPLAAALDATRELVVALRRRGDTALVVVLTDGRANIARDGSAGRPQAEADATASAHALRSIDVDAVLIDTSPKPHAHAARLAAEMGARYRPLPHADARAMSTIVSRASRERTDTHAA